MKKIHFEQYLLIVLALLAGLSLYFSYTSPLALAIHRGALINGLLIGTDGEGATRHADTLVFVNYDPAQQFLNIISIPRDAYCTPEGARVRRIGDVYAFHYRNTNSDVTASQETRYGVEQLVEGRAKIPYYVQVDYDAFRRFIDLLGGVKVTVTEPMDYDDNAGGLHIHFATGTWHMDGRQSLDYVRYRGKGGDIGRIYRQQRFLKAVLARFKDPVVLFRLPVIIPSAARQICTNLSPWDIVACAVELKNMKTDGIRLAQLPGTQDRDCWDIDLDRCYSLFDKILPSTSTVSVPAVRKLRIEVLNASGRKKLEDEVSWLLRRNGFDVVTCGQLTVHQQRTIIKDFTGDLHAPQKIALTLSCGEVVTRYDARRLIDMSVILGEDCSVDVSAQGRPAALPAQ